MTLEPEESALINKLRIVKANQNAKGSFDKVWVEHNVHEEGKKGMKIHAKFSAKNLKDIPCRMNAYFRFDSGKKLKDSNNLYCAEDGQVCVGTNFKPGYDFSTYSDLEIFMPYDELHMASGKHSLKFRLGLYVKGGDFFAWSHYVYFTYNDRTKEEEERNRIAFTLYQELKSGKYDLTQGIFNKETGEIITD